MAARSTFSQRFGLFSPILEKQIADLVSKSKAPEPKDYYIQTYKTIHQQASCLYGYLEPILGRLNDEDLIKFQHKGFDAFSSIVVV